MLLVKTLLKPSGISGLGLYAAEDIPAETKVWTFTYGLDMIISKFQIDAMGLFADYISKYAWMNRGTIYLAVDDARFMNHSTECNVIEKDSQTSIARRDISAGEELTCNYYALGETKEDLIFNCAKL